MKTEFDEQRELLKQLLLENRELKSLLEHIMNGGYYPDKCAACEQATKIVRR